VYKVLQQNYQVLEKASKYLQINLQSVQGDIQDAKNISQALKLLAEAQFLLSPSPSNTVSNIVGKIQQWRGQSSNNTSSPNNIISIILANKDTILNYISQALQLLSESESYDMESTAKQLFGIAQKYQTQVQTYLEGLEETQQALDYLNTVNALVNQQPNANSPSAYFLALQNNYAEALRVLKNAMSSAMQANSLFEQINATPPFDMNQLETENTMLQQFIQLFGTTASAYSAIENALNSKSNLSTPSDYVKYYQNVASTVQNAIQEINSLQITDNDVDQVRQQIIQSLQKSETDYLALSHAFSIIASATTEPVRYARRPSMTTIGGSVNSLQTLAQAYQQASQYLSQYPDLQSIAQQFANMSEFYTLIAQASELLQQAQASSSPSTEISLMEQAKGYLQQALQYVPSNSQAYQQIQSEIANINQAVSVLQKAQSLVQQINNAINNGASDPHWYVSALYYYNELLQTTQGTNINNVINDVDNNNYFQAIQDVNNNTSLQPQQKQFLNSLIATIGITTYYLPLMQSSLQSAHLQASSWLQALSETFNFVEQMQPVATNLQNALQYAQDAENLAQYVSPQLQQNLSQIVSQIQEQYNAIEEQIQKAQSNWGLNVFEGFANTFNTGLSNMMNDINNFIYSHLGKNTFTEILAGLADAGVFIAISAIPIVGQVFDALTFISFIGSTAFDLLAGSASFNETISSFEQMFTNPTSITTIVTLITAVLARKFIEPDDIESGSLVKSMDGVKSALSKIEDSIKYDANVSKISNKVTGTVQSSVTKSPDFSKVTNLVKEVNLDKLDIDALKKLSNKIVKIEGDAYEFVDTDISDTKITTTIVDIFKNVKIKVFDGVDEIKVKLSKALPKDIEADVEPKLINDIVTTFKNDKLEITRIDENTLKNKLFLNFPEALDTIELNLSATIARQLFDALKKADGNVVRISPNEDIAYFGGKFYDIVFKDGKVVKMEIIDGTMAYAKLVKFADDAVGKFITLNKDLIEQLLKSGKNLQSIEYELTNKLTGNVVRNEYLKLKDVLGNETTFTSKTEINPNEIKTINEIIGKNLPKSKISRNIGYLTPQELDDLLSFDNEVSRIFKPLIDEHPEVKDLLERLAFEGKLPASLKQLEEIADKIESFYDALDKEVKDIENKLRSNPLFNGVDIESVVKTMVRQIVKNDPYDVVDGKAPKISLLYVLKHLSTSDKAEVVLNYLKTDPEIYDEVMKKLSNFSADTRDYILAEVYDRIVIGIKDDEPIIAGDLEYVVKKIDNIINNISSKGSKTSVSTSTPTANATSGGSVSNTSVSAPTTNSAPNTGTSTTGSVSNSSANGTSTVLQPPAQQGILKRISLTIPFENMLSSLFPDFDKLSPAVKTLFENIVARQLDEEGELTKEDIMKALEDAKAEYQAILDSIKKLVNGVKAETTSVKEEESVLENLDTSIGELEKKVQFDLKRLSYFLSMVSFVADKFNVATAIELLNQLNSLTPQQLQRTIILTQPQLETIAKIAPLLKELIVKLDNGAKLKDLQDLVVKIREALEKAEINLDVEELIKIINVVQTMTKEFNLKTSEMATLITENDVNNLKVIPVPVISNLNLKSLIIPTTQPGNTNTTVPENNITPGTEEIPETSLEVGTIPLQGEALQQLQQLLQQPTATPPNINPSEEGGNQGGGGVTVPPSYSTPQTVSYRSRQQYLII
jgi:hypothetical protein